MKTHWDHLESLVPGLSRLAILDLGSGRGKFLLEAAKRGARQVACLEPNEPYIALTNEAAREAGVSVRVEKGVAEKMPFPDASFDFINIAEVIEHVESPEAMLAEVRRVLVPGGRAYLSVPNRFGLKDQHFHLYFVNWLPRSLSDAFIGVFGRHKAYEEKGAGRQRLADMHYYTWKGIRDLLRRSGFAVTDIRALRIERTREPARALLRLAYSLARSVYFDAFHILVEKPVR